MKVKFENGLEIKMWFSYQGTSTVLHCLYEEKEWKATAFLSKHDSFVKAVGRRMALTRFLKKGCLPWMPEWPRDARRLIWNEYFKQHADLRRGRA